MTKVYSEIAGIIHGIRISRLVENKSLGLIDAESLLLIGEKAKVSANILNSCYTTPGKLKKYQADLFSDRYELAKGQMRDDINEKISKYIEDFKGLKLTYWQKKVIIAFYCLIEKQDASRQRPFIKIHSKTDLYREVLGKNKNGKGYNWGERKLLDKALEELQTKKQQIVFTKTKRVKDKKIREYIIVESVLITERIYYRKSINNERGLKEGDIKEKGRQVIKFNPIIFDGLIDRWRLIPKNLTREIKMACPEVKRVTPLIEDFIYWLHSHSYKLTEIKRNRLILINELGLEKAYRHNKERTLKKIFKTYQIAKKVGYLKDYLINQKGKRKSIDIFILNPIMYEHIQRWILKNSHSNQKANKSC